MPCQNESIFAKGGKSFWCISLVYFVFQYNQHGHTCYINLDKNISAFKDALWINVYKKVQDQRSRPTANSDLDEEIINVQPYKHTCCFKRPLSLSCAVFFFFLLSSQPSVVISISGGFIRSAQCIH